MIKSSLSLKTFLILSGLIGVAVGIAVLFFPVPFYAISGIELGGNVSLLNEIRAPGGALIATGTLILLGVFVARLTYGALVISTVTYLAYGFSRLLSMAVDGLPTMDLIVVAFFEIVIGLCGVFVWAKYRPAEPAFRSVSAE